MAIPKQVEEAATLAEDLHGKMFPVETPSEEVPAAVEPTADPVTPVEPVVPVEPVAPVAVADPVVETPVEPVVAVEETWEEKYAKLEQQHKTLKGKYDNEVPESRSRADRLENEMKDFKQSIITDMKALTTAPAEETPPEESARRDRAKKYVEEYGDEYVGDQKAYFMEEVLPLIKEHFKPVEEKVSSVEEVQTATAQKEFAAMVDKDVNSEGWQNDWVNEGSNPELEAFLKMPDPSGLFTNGQLAELYNNNQQGEKFAILLNRFYEAPAATSAPVTEPAPAAVVPAEASATPAVAPEPDAAIAPNRSTPQTVLPDAGDKTIWTQTAMDAFYKKDNKGEYSDEESKALWDDLLMAPVEGRIASH